MISQHIVRLLIVFLPCLFITLFLLHQEKDDFYYELHVVQKNISLEPIVAQLKNCTQRDRIRQHSLLRTLHAWSKFTAEHRIIYRIAFGTLVGYVQRTGLLPHDQDIDVVIPWQETIRLEMLSRTSFSENFYLLVQPLWRYPYYENRTYFHSQGIHFVAPNARFVDRINGYFVDIWPSYERIPNLTINALSSIENGTTTEYNTRYDFITLPNDWIYPFQRCDFSEIPVWCPAKPEKFVVKLYGEMALNTSDTVCRNGTWH